MTKMYDTVSSPFVLNWVLMQRSGLGLGSWHVALDACKDDLNAPHPPSCTSHRLALPGPHYSNPNPSLGVLFFGHLMWFLERWSASVDGVDNPQFPVSLSQGGQEAYAQP